MITNFINKHKAAQILDCHPGSLYRYRKSDDWFEGVHFIEVNSRKILYNKPLIEDWLLNRDNPHRHLLTVEKFVKEKSKTR